MRNARLAVSLLVLAALLEPGRVSPAAGGTPAAPDPGRPFSRARWIEEHEHEARFDAGALPGRRAPSTAGAVAAEALAAPAATPRVRNTQVSFDLLEPDSSTQAQPETQAEPFLAVDPANERRLLAGFQEDRFADGGARALTWALSTDGGRRWKNGLVPQLTVATGGPWERASDPWVAFGPDHRAYYVSLAFDESRPDNAIVVSSSADGGATWGPPVTVHSPSGRDFDDKEAIVVDTRADSPFRGRVYVTWDTVRDDGTGQPVLFSWSEDGGASFSPPVTVGTGVNIGAVPLVGPGGVLHVVWARYSGAMFDTVELFTARSDDGGATWSAPVKVDDAFPAGVPGMRTGEGLPAAAVDPRSGGLYVVWQDARHTGGVDQVVISRSTDGGESWSPAALVSDGPTDAPAFTPGVAVDKHGRVGVAYYSLRNDPDRRLLVDEYLAFSTNGGQGFAASRRVSQASWDATWAAFARGKFLGDYQGLVAGDRLFHPLFVATFRPSPRFGGRYQPDVYTITVR